jgi:hypothetical protein
MNTTGGAASESPGCAHEADNPKTVFGSLPVRWFYLLCAWYTGGLLDAGDLSEIREPSLQVFFRDTQLAHYPGVNPSTETIRD